MYPMQWFSRIPSRSSQCKTLLWAFIFVEFVIFYVMWGISHAFWILYAMWEFHRISYYKKLTFWKIKVFKNNAMQWFRRIPSRSSQCKTLLWAFIFVEFVIFYVMWGISHAFWILYAMWEFHRISYYKKLTFWKIKVFKNNAQSN